MLLFSAKRYFKNTYKIMVFMGQNIAFGKYIPCPVERFAILTIFNAKVCTIRTINKKTSNRFTLRKSAKKGLQLEI